MANQLAQEFGWSCVIVTALLYAARKPRGQKVFFVRTVEEIMLQGVAIMMEAAALACYFLSQSGDHKVCFSGFSWGAATSAAAAMVTLSCHPNGKRLACVPYVGCRSPNIIADGALACAVDWTALQKTASEPQCITRDTLFRILSKQNIDGYRDLIVGQGKSLGAVRLLCMTNDHFINARYANDFCDVVMGATSAGTDIKVTSLLGGHVMGQFLRPWYQKQAIVEAVEALR